MECKNTLEKVRKIFEGDRFATENGAVIEEIGHHTATCSLMITDSHRNAMGAVMGGTYFMLADFAFAVAANWEMMGCVSLRSDISFLGAAKGEKLIAKEVCIKEGRTTACLAFCESARSRQYRLLPRFPHPRRHPSDTAAPR